MGKLIRNIVLLSILAGNFLFPGLQDSWAAGTLAPPLDKLRYQTGQADYSAFLKHRDTEFTEGISRSYSLCSQCLCGEKKVGQILVGYSHAWGENVGWVDFRPAGAKLEIGANILTGWIEIKTLGWIYLGDGKPGNGYQYSNTDAQDYGVNNNGNGNLSGWGWSENAGWVNFDGVNILEDGAFSGHAWSENVGRIKFQATGVDEYSVKTDPYPWREIGVGEEIKSAKSSFPCNESESIGPASHGRIFIIPPSSISLDIYLDTGGKRIEDAIVLRFESTENKIDFRIDDPTRHARGPPEREQPNQIYQQFVVQSFRAADKVVLNGCTASNLCMDI